MVNESSISKRNSKSLRIGIVLTRLKAEKKKDELVSISSRSRPWLSGKNAPKLESWMTIVRDSKKYTSADISMGKYIEWNFKNVDVDYIKPEDISIKRFKTNDLNFMLIYDLLESFHVDSKKVFDNFKNTIEKSNNIYPPKNMQKFINDKNCYITHLTKMKEKDMIPSYCIYSDMFKKKGIEWACKEVEKMSKKWGGRFIGKPIYGQESIDFKKFENCEDSGLKEYMRRCFKKYPGILFQKYIEGFDRNLMECRVYFIDGKYRYTVITAGDRVSFPKKEQGYTALKCHKKVIDKAKRVIKKIPPFKIQGIEVPKVFIRVDVATNKGCPPYLVNELEFFASLYIEDVNTIPEPLLGDSLVKVVKKLKRGLKNRRNN